MGNHVDNVDKTRKAAWCMGYSRYMVRKTNVDKCRRIAVDRMYWAFAVNNGM